MRSRLKKSREKSIEWTQKCEVDLKKVMFRAGSKRTCSCGGVDKEKSYGRDAKMRSRLRKSQGKKSIK